MQSTHNWKDVVSGYYKSYTEAIENNRKTLPYSDIQDWTNVLDPVALRIYQDIRVFGLLLYPIFPVTDSQFLHFANPFNMVGIEIVYKNSSRTTIDRKLEFLRGAGWTVYETISQKSYYTIDDYYEFIAGKDKIFDYLEYDDQMEFIEKHKERNTACLLKFIYQKHFTGYNYGNQSSAESFIDLENLT